MFGYLVCLPLLMIILSVAGTSEWPGNFYWYSWPNCCFCCVSRSADKVKLSLFFIIISSIEAPW